MNQDIVAVVGLGYVGLPLALEFGTKFKTIGFDVSLKRISSLQKGIDTNGDIPSHKFEQSKQVIFTNDSSLIKTAALIVIAVPTPVDSSNTPDLTILKKASELVGKNISHNAIVVFESTVYPGATEEDCIPIIEKYSGLTWKKDFYVGYSPERVNPGDKQHTIENILKVVSGDTPDTLEKISYFYSSIIKAGIFKASSIKVAEAAKVIENTQRDLNIALINELSKIFSLMDVSTYDVLAAASTKWNFLPFEPGLVGGHCIGVDPYYLTHKAERLGYHPEVILAGRRINDTMAKYVAHTVIKKLMTTSKGQSKFKVNILGISFKENVSDIRNSKVVDLYNELMEFGIEVYISDPLASADEVFHEYGINLTSLDLLTPADAVILAVAHDEFKSNITKILDKCLFKDCYLFDLKFSLGTKEFKNYWTL